MSMISGKVSGVNLCTAQGKGPEQVQGERLGPARVGTGSLEILLAPDHSKGKLQYNSFHAS